MTADAPLTLSEVLPGVAAALGAGPETAHTRFRPPSASRAVVVLVDGLGDLLLAERASYAPFLASLRDDGRPVTAGFPSTTATSMGSFGTGLPPGGHGLVGYEVRDPATGRLLNELQWQDGPDPIVWQPNSTVFETVIAAGVDAVQIGPGYFQGSGLTVAALRGPRFVAATSLADRVDAAAEQVRRSPRSLVYLYWGEVDKVGHEFGVGSHHWLEELQAVDLAMRMLARRLPRGTLLVVTADHGMIDVPFTSRIDLADDGAAPALLREEIEVVGGEPRAPMLYTSPDAAHRVRDRWVRVLGDDADVLLRDEAITAGWFGAVDDRVRPRIGDVVVALKAVRSVHDSRTQRPQLARLLGLHGSRTDVESRIPLLVTTTDG
jgi:predicted AlkP superfamily pyrophosphatase or phosphodiesterase